MKWRFGGTFLIFHNKLQFLFQPPPPPMKKEWIYDGINLSSKFKKEALVQKSDWLVVPGRVNEYNWIGKFALQETFQRRWEAENGEIITSDWISSWSNSFFPSTYKYICIIHHSIQPVLSHPTFNSPPPTPSNPKRFCIANYTAARVLASTK